MTDPVIFSLNEGSGEQDPLGAYYDYAATENRSADSAPGLVSLGFITAALGRSARLLSVIAIVGLILGVGDYKERPHQYQATATVLVTLSTYENAQTAAVDDQAIAETRAVARLAVQEFGLKQSISSLLSSYIAVSSTDRLLTVTASAPSASQAVLLANAVASAFLKFRASELQDQQNLVQQSLDQQVNLTKQQLNSINAQISQLTSAAQQSQLAKLQVEQKTVMDTLGNEEGAATANQTVTLAALTAALKNSQILSVVPLPHSRLKPLVTYAAIGLIMALALGFSIVVVRALVSDRLRRRDDIAYTLDAPVKLSVGPLRKRRLLMPWPGRKTKRDQDMRRVVAHLHSALPRNSKGAAGLAIVAVDNAPVVARAVAALAISCVGQGNQLVTADLSSGIHLARLLGSKKPGTYPVNRSGVNFTMAVPDRDDPAPVGPQPSATSTTRSGQAGHELVASYGSADLLLTFATLDPALGGAHLATWATNAVVMVSAGQSSAERIRGVGEMIRLAGLRLESVVLIGADKRDESLGLTRRSDEQAGIGILAR